MTRGDSPEFRFGGLRGDAIEETSPFPSPRAPSTRAGSAASRRPQPPRPQSAHAGARGAIHPHEPREGSAPTRFLRAAPPDSASRQSPTDLLALCGCAQTFARVQPGCETREHLSPGSSRTRRGGLNRCLVSQSGFWYRTITASTGRGRYYLLDPLIRPACSPGLRRGGWTRRRSGAAAPALELVAQGQSSGAPSSPSFDADGGP